MDIEGKKCLVVGAGLSGIASAGLLLEKGADVIVYDGSQKLCVSDIRAKSEKLKDVPIVLGELRPEDMGQFSIAVFSPGVPTDTPMADALRAHGVEIWGEVELAYCCAKGRIAAITGTNGKTTTTALTGEILKSRYSDVKIAGNIGIPYTSLALQTTDDTVTALEISSFQLETVQTFHPDVSAILNITPDHLDRHHTMECYTAAKTAVAKNQKPGQTCVLNYEDSILRAFGETLEKRSLNVIYFSSKRKLARGLYLEDGAIYLADDLFPATGAAEKLIDVSDMHLLGTHNYENAMAAVAVSLALGVPPEKIMGILKTFQGVEHRIEYAGEIRGVRYYNDSKATNPDAAIQGIRAMSRPTYLIGGGYDKQSVYGDWIDAFEGRVKKLVLLGATKEKIATAAREKGFTDIVLCDSFEEAVAYCHANAQSGDAVLLSPACASWDMFKSYEERGRMFKKLIREFQK